MKLKFRFLESLWPFPKQSNTLFDTSPDIREKTEKRYIIGLLILWIIVFLFSIVRCKAQERPLKVGDRIPDITYSNVLNYKSNTLKLSDFKGQVVMLDFWATWCGSCLAAFPHEYELEHNLPGILKIILVDCKSTKDSPEKVAKFLEERKASYQFTSVSNDTILRKFFPHPGGLPHFVWIKDNVVVGIPDRNELTEANISAVYNGKARTIAQYKYIPFNMTEEVFKNGNGGEPSKLLCHTSLFGYKTGLEKYMGLIFDDSDRVSRIDIINRSRIEMIQYSLTDGAEIRKDRILFNVSKSSDYSSDSVSEAWKLRNCFVYESTFLPRSRNSALLLMQADLQRFWCIHYYIVARDTECFVITLLDTAKIPKGRRGVHAESNFLDHRNEPVFFRNTVLSTIAGQLEDYYKMPVIDDTGYNHKISLNLPANVSDIKAVTNSLEKQGLKISRGKRRIQYLVVEDSLPTTTSN